MRQILAIFFHAAAAACLAQTVPGPTLLSRGNILEAQPVRSEIIFSPSIGALSGYDNGPFTTGLSRSGGRFEELDGGLAARLPGKRADLRLDYQFGIRHYADNSRLDRSNHVFNLDARFLLSPRLAVFLHDAATSSSFGGSFQTPQGGFDSFFDPGPEAFHARTVVNTARAGVVYSPSVRTSISVAGDGFLVQRQLHALVDSLGWRARADVARRYTRNKTVSLSYSFTHFDHTRSFGGADYAVLAVAHSMRLTRTSELDLLAGAGRLRSAGVRSVDLDPEIAALLGTARGAEIFRLNTWIPHLMAAWVQGAGRGELRLEAGRLVSDGGGLTGLARQNYGSLTFQSRHRGAWHSSSQLMVRTYRSLDTLLYHNTTALTGITIARRLSPRTEAVLRYHFAFYNFQGGLLHNFRRHEMAAGVMWHPGELSPARADLPGR